IRIAAVSAGAATAASRGSCTIARSNTPGRRGGVIASIYGAYVNRFGFTAGTSLYLGAKWRRGLMTVDLPGAPPLVLRGGTSDRDAFNEIFVRRWYDHPYPGTPRFI